nr:MAG TPA: hypothetical protein [Bacteriophage sp.]
MNCAKVRTLSVLTAGLSLKQNRLPKIQEKMQALMQKHYSAAKSWVFRNITESPKLSYWLLLLRQRLNLRLLHLKAMLATMKKPKLMSRTVKLRGLAIAAQPEKMNKRLPVMKTPAEMMSNKYLGRLKPPLFHLWRFEIW